MDALVLAGQNALIPAAVHPDIWRTATENLFRENTMILAKLLRHPKLNGQMEQMDSIDPKLENVNCTENTKQSTLQHLMHKIS